MTDDGLTLIAEDELPGAGISTSAVVEWAAELGASGANLQDGTSDVLRAWQTLPSSYASTGADRLYVAMDEVHSQGHAIGTALQAVDKALNAYAGDVEATLSKIQDLRSVVQSFRHEALTSYPKEVNGSTGQAPSGSDKLIAQANGVEQAAPRYDRWQDDFTAVDQNHWLRGQARQLAAELMEKQLACATRIRKAAGLPAAHVQEIRRTEQALRSTDLSWNSAVEIENHEEGCAGSTNRTMNGILWNGLMVHGLGVPMLSATGLVGYDIDSGWSGKNAAASWKALGTGVYALTLLNPVNAGLTAAQDSLPSTPSWKKDLDKAAGSSLLSNLGVVGAQAPKRWWEPDAWAKNDFFAPLKRDGWQQTLGAAIPTIVSSVFGGGAALKGLALARAKAAGTLVLAEDTSVGARYVTTPSGVTYDIPAGWTAHEARNGKGIVFQDPDVTDRSDRNSLRIMEPTAQYPKGYAIYYNSANQPLNPRTGKPGGRPEHHVPAEFIGEYKGWPQ